MTQQFRVLNRLLLAIACTTIVCALVPSGAAAQPAGQDSVTGGGAGQYFGETISLTVDASSGPGGENPQGTVAASRGGVQIFSGSVVSLHVSGSSATLEAREAAVASLVLLVDDRPAGDHVLLSCTAPGCFPPAFFDFTLASGDIVVREAPPLPTKGEQCKNGGWKTYAVFTDQGDCVSFVATGGRNPPGNG